MTDYNFNVRCIPRIKQHYALLCNSEKKAADVVLDNWRSVLEMSVAEWAATAKVSQASVVRFCQAIGFKSFSAFKQYLWHEEMTAEETDFLNIRAEDTFTDLAKKTYRFNINVIKETMSVLDLKRVDAAAEAIVRAKNINIFGVGASGISAYMMMNSFLQMGLPCSYHSDPAHQIYSAAKMQSDEVAISVTHSGSMRDTIESISLAKKQGATAIAIVGIIGSPLDKIADISLYCGLGDDTFISDLISSRISELNVISILNTMIVHKLGNKLGDYRSKNREIMKIKRV